MTIKSAVDYCSSALKDVSRSFAISIPMMGDKIMEPVMVAYLEARILDNFEDEEGLVTLTNEERREKIDQVVRIICDPEDKSVKECVKELAKSAKTTISNPCYQNLVLNMDRILELHKTFDKTAKDALKKWLTEMSVGMKKFLDIEIKTFKQLRQMNMLSVF